MLVLLFRENNIVSDRFWNSACPKVQSEGFKACSKHESCQVNNSRSSVFYDNSYHTKLDVSGNAFHGRRFFVSGNSSRTNNKLAALSPPPQALALIPSPRLSTHANHEPSVRQHAFRGRTGMNTTKAKSNCWTCKGEYARVYTGTCFHSQSPSARIKPKRKLNAGKDCHHLEQPAEFDKHVQINFTHTACITVVNKRAQIVKSAATEHFLTVAIAQKPDAYAKAMA
jgi:hypothetical protein